jgi:hypothetical protein
MSVNSCQWTLHYRSHSLTVQLRTVLLTVLATQQTASKEQSGYCYMCASTYCRAIHLASPVINKESGGKLYSSHAWS